MRRRRFFGSRPLYRTQEPPRFEVVRYETPEQARLSLKIAITSVRPPALLWSCSEPYARLNSIFPGFQTLMSSRRARPIHRGKEPSLCLPVRPPRSDAFFRASTSTRFDILRRDTTTFSLRGQYLSSAGTSIMSIRLVLGYRRNATPPAP